MVMSLVIRGFKNAFRDIVETVSIIAIIAISIGLALTMVLAINAVQKRIDEVQGAIGSTITLSPVGQQFGSGGSPLYASSINGIENIPHIVKVTEAFSDRLSSPDIDLSSSVDLGGTGQQGSMMFSGGMPVYITGINDAAGYKAVSGHDLNVVAGTTIDMSKDANGVMVGQGLANKNNLAVGSTFSAYGAKSVVKGIFDTGNTWADNVVVFPLKTVQRLSGRQDEISMALIQVDAPENVATVQSAVEAKAGSAADITSSADIIKDAVGPLEDVRGTALADLIASLAVGAAVIFLSMLVFIHMRRREIGILKAIGASNRHIILQFAIEAIVLAIAGTIAGVGVGLILNSSIFSILTQNLGGSSGGPVSADLLNLGFKVGWGAFSTIRNATEGVHTVVNPAMIIYGLIAAIGITAAGAIGPAWYMARLRPTEAIRPE